MNAALRIKVLAQAEQALAVFAQLEKRIYAAGATAKAASRSFAGFNSDAQRTSRSIKTAAIELERFNRAARKTPKSVSTNVSLSTTGATAGASAARAARSSRTSRATTATAAPVAPALQVGGGASDAQAQSFVRSASAAKNLVPALAAVAAANKNVNQSVNEGIRSAADQMFAQRALKQTMQELIEAEVTHASVMSRLEQAKEAAISASQRLTAARKNEARATFEADAAVRRSSSLPTGSEGAAAAVKEADAARKRLAQSTAATDAAEQKLAQSHLLVAGIERELAEAADDSTRARTAHRASTDALSAATVELAAANARAAASVEAFEASLTNLAGQELSVAQAATVSAKAAEHVTTARKNLTAATSQVQAAQGRYQASLAGVIAAEELMASVTERVDNARERSARAASAVASAEARAAQLAADGHRSAAAAAVQVQVASQQAATAAEDLARAEAQLAAVSGRVAASRVEVVAAERALIGARAEVANATQGAARAEQALATAHGLSAAAEARAAAASQTANVARTSATSRIRNNATALRDLAARQITAGKNTQWLGRILSQNFTLPLALAAGVGAKFAFDFEASMTRLRKVYNGSSSDIDQFAKGFRALSDIFGIHVEEVADIGAAWAQAGAEGAQLAQLTRSTVEAMLLGDLDAETAIGGLISVMGAFELQASELTQVLAILNKVENETAVNFSDLLTVFQKTSGTARIAGVSIRELAAMAASLIPVAGNASEAGNALKTLIPRVMAPRTREAREAFAALGVEVDSLAFNSKNFTQRIEELTVGWAKATQQQKINFATYVFGNRQISRGITLLDDILDANGRYQKALDATADSSENFNTYTRELNTLLESNPQRFKILTNRIRNLLIEAMIPLLPVINNLLSLLVRLAYGFGNLNPTLQTLIVGFAVVLAAAGPLLSALGLLRILVYLPLKGIALLVLRLYELGGASLFAQLGLGLIAGILGVIVFALAGGGLEGALYGVATAMLFFGVTSGSTFVALGGIVALGAAVGYTLGGIEGALYGVALAAGVVALVIGGWPAIIVAAVAAVAAIAYTLVTRWNQLPQFFRTAMESIAKSIRAGVSFIPRMFAAALTATIRIVARAIAIIWDLLSYLNPFARHSPSLVEQVTEGTAIISRQYGNLSRSVGGSLARTEAAVRRLTAALAGARAAADQAKLAENIELAGLVGVDAGTIIETMASIRASQAELDGLGGAIKAQERVVNDWDLALQAANDTLDAANDRLSELQDVVSAIDEQIGESQSRLQEWLSAPVIGSHRFEDVGFALDMNSSDLQLQLKQIERAFAVLGFSVGDYVALLDEQTAAADAAADANYAIGDSLLWAGLSASDAEDRMGRLASQIESLRGKEHDLRMAGAGSDVLAGIQGNIAQAELARRQLAPIAASGGGDDEKSLSDLPPELSGMLEEYQTLQRLFDMNSLDIEILNLEEALQLGPARKAIQDTQRVAEHSMQAILNGIAQETAAQRNLVAQRDAATAAVERQQVVVDGLTAARDRVQAVYDGERQKLEQLQESYSQLEEAINGANAALEEAIALGSDVKAAEEAAAGAGGGAGDLGDFDVPDAGGLLPENLEDVSLEDLIQQWIDEGIDSFETSFGGFKDQILGKFSGLFDPIRNIFDKLGLSFGFGDNLTRAKNSVTDFVSGLWDSFKNSGLVARLKEWWNGIWDFLKEEIWRPLVENLLPKFAEAWDKVQAKIDPLVQAFKELWASISDEVGLALLFAQAVIWAFALWLEGTFTLIVSILEGAFKFVGPIIAVFWETFTRIAGAAIEMVGGLLSGFITIVTGIIKIIAGLMSGDWALIWEGVKLVFSGVWEQIRAIFWGAINIIWALAQGFVGTFQAIIEGGWALIKNIFQRMIDWIGSTFFEGWQNARDKIVDAFRALPGLLGGAMSGIGRSMSGPLNVAIGIINGFAKGVNWVADKLGLSWRIPLIGLVSGGGSGGGGSANFMAAGGLIPSSEVGGGFITDGARAIVGEGSRTHPEFVIPTDPKYRSRAIMLAQELMGSIGLQRGGQVPQYATGGILQWLIQKAVNTGVSAHNKLVGAVDTARARMSGVGGLGGQMGRTALERIIDYTWDKAQGWIKNFMRTGSANGGESLQSRSVGTAAPRGSSNYMAMGGNIPVYPMAAGAYVKGGMGGVLAHIGEGSRDEIVVPLNRALGRMNNGSQSVDYGSGSGDRVVNIYGDLSFPNVESADDVEGFLNNLEAVAG